MIILREVTFSEKKENIHKSTKNNTLKNIGVSGSAGALAVGSGVLNDRLGKKSIKDIYREISDKEFDVITRINKRVQKSGANVDTRTDTPGGPGYHAKTDKIYMDKSATPSIFAHECGHRHYHQTKSKRLVDLVGKAVHKINPYAKMASHDKFVMGNGAFAGIKKAVKESNGEKQSKINKHQAWVYPAVVGIPTLVAEGMATGKGLRILKRAGADKTMMRKAKKELATAGSTYIADYAKKIAKGQLAKEGAYHLTKNILKKKTKED